MVLIDQMAEPLLAERSRVPTSSVPCRNADARRPPGRTKALSDLEKGTAR